MLAGAVLAFAQALVLRHHVERAWLWLPANMLAWLVGMPVVFLGIDLAMRTGATGGAVAVVLVTLALTGAAVGVINGSFLVRMVPPRLEP